MAVRTIPEGYHSLTPYLICKEASKAIDFYTKAFGAQETVRMPGPIGQVMHAEVKIGNSTLMLADENAPLAQAVLRLRPNAGSGWRAMTSQRPERAFAL